MDGIQIPNKLEVPPKRSDNISMMNKKDAIDVVYDRTEDLYWTLKDSCDDEGGDKLDNLVQEFRDKAVTVLMDHSA
jgi:hypothetical protein